MERFDDNFGASVVVACVPLRVLMDWLFVSRGEAWRPWWWPVVWIVGPLGYLALYVQGAQLHDISPYSKYPRTPTSPTASSSFWPSVAWLFASFLPLLFAVWARR